MDCRQLPQPWGWHKVFCLSASGEAPSTEELSSAGEKEPLNFCCYKEEGTLLFEESAEISLYLFPGIKKLKVTPWNFSIPRSPYLWNAATALIPL